MQIVKCKIQIGNQHSAIRISTSLAFLVSRVLPAEPAELAQLEALGRLLLVLRRAVIAPLTFGAGERDDVSHGSGLSQLVTW
jgi:hypothetical protein